MKRHTWKGEIHGSSTESGEYSFWSNFKFTFGPVWREKRSYIRDMILEIIFSVAVPLMGSALSALVIRLLGNDVGILTLILCIMSAFLGYALVNAAQTFIVSKHASHNIEMRLELFYPQMNEKTLHMPLEKYEDADIRRCKEKADMSLCNNWGGVEGFMRYTGSLGAGILGLIVYSFITGMVHPLILGMMLAMSVVSALINQLPNRYYNRIKDRLASEQMTIRYIDRVVDQVQGGKDIRIFGLKNWIIGKYDQAIMESRRLLVRRDLLRFVGNLADGGFDAVRSLVCYLYLIYLLQQGMPLSEFVFYLGIVGGFSVWFQKISGDFVKIRQCSKEINDLRKYLDIGEYGEDKNRIPDNGFETVEIVFDHVSYAYKGSEKMVLSDVSFRMKAGEHKALVGLNGAGKSTLVKLISGLYLPTDGTVYVNGVDTRELDHKEYYRHESAVFQETFITSYSIAENIAMSEEWDEELVWNSLREAGLYEKVNSLPEKLNTYLGKDISENGISLSGGETQKLLLARALYKQPSLVLLDEPTAALDALAESEIYETYSKTLKNKTALFISHRLASTRFCDEIILLADGKIAERGTHEELMEKRGEYARLFQVQSKYYEEGGSCPCQ